jgi:hypothetical protein
LRRAREAAECGTDQVESAAETALFLFSLLHRSESWLHKSSEPIEKRP